MNKFPMIFLFFYGLVKTFNLLKSSESGIEMSVSPKNEGHKNRVKNKIFR